MNIIVIDRYEVCSIKYFGESEPEKKREKRKGKKNRIVTLFNVINYRDSGDCSVKK